MTLPSYARWLFGRAPCCGILRRNDTTRRTAPRGTATHLVRTQLERTTGNICFDVVRMQRQSFCVGRLRSVPVYDRHVNDSLYGTGERRGPSLHFARGIGDAKCILVTAVCVCVCLSVPRRILTLLH